MRLLKITDVLMNNVEGKIKPKIMLFNSEVSCKSKFSLSQLVFLI